MITTAPQNRGSALIEYSIFLIPLLLTIVASMDAYNALHSYRALGEALHAAADEIALIDSREELSPRSPRVSMYQWRIFPVRTSFADGRPFVGSPEFDSGPYPEGRIPSQCLSQSGQFICTREFSYVTGDPSGSNGMLNVDRVLSSVIAPEISLLIPRARLDEGCDGNWCVKLHTALVSDNGRESARLTISYALPLRMWGNSPLSIRRSTLVSLQRAHIDRSAHHRIFNCSFTGRGDYSDCREE